jgi:hypothetical protein
LLGTCKSLLFFLLPDVIKVVEPFTGESIIVPPSPARYMHQCPSVYGLGFDAKTRQYKIVHGPCNSSLHKIEAPEQDMHVFTVGADKEWRTVRIACSLHRASYDDELASGDGAVYWRCKTPGGTLKHARFDLTTEEITPVDHWLVVDRMPVRTIACKYPGTWSGLCDIGIRWFGEWEDGRWPHDITALPHKIRAERLGRRRVLPKGHALQRGHLLLQEEDASLYAREIESSNTSLTEIYLGREKLLIGTIGQETKVEEPIVWYKFVLVHRRHQEGNNKSPATRSYQVDVPIIEAYENRFLCAFAYTPTLSLASARSTY